MQGRTEFSLYVVALITVPNVICEKACHLLFSAASDWRAPLVIQYRNSVIPFIFRRAIHRQRGEEEGFFWMFIAYTSYRKLFTFFINFLTISRDLLSLRCNMLKSFPIKCHLKWKSERNFKKAHHCGRFSESARPDQPCLVQLPPKLSKAQGFLKVKCNVLNYSDWLMC